MSIIAGIQLPTLPMSGAKLDYYIKTCKNKGVSLVVLGEYVLNNFVTELNLMPRSMIKDQSSHKLELLKSLSKTYDITIIAPLVLVKEKSITKVTVKTTAKSTYFYEHFFLMPYEHWNEKSFFDKIKTDYQLPVFFHDGLRCAIVSGFELHFDNIWQEVLRKNIDLVLMPSASSFESSHRWNMLIQTRAFLNNVYIFRVNRIGNCNVNKYVYNFYGDSSLTNPWGVTEINLSDKEEVLCVNVNKENIQEARKTWRFRNIALEKLHRV